MKPFTKTLKLNRPLHHLSAGDATVEYRFTRDAIEKLSSEAFNRGRQDGEERVGQQMIELRKEVAELQTGLLNTLSRTHKKVAEEAEQALVELTLAVAEKLVSGLEVDAERVTAAIGEAIKQFEDCSEYDVMLHPEDLALLEHAGDPQAAGFTKNDKFRLEPSSEVTRGGCIVKTAFGSVDSRRETKLTLLKEALLS